MDLSVRLSVRSRLLLGIILLLSVPAYGQVNIVTVPGTSNVTVGSEFDVVVQVQAGAQQVDTAQAYLNFDPAKVQVVSITAGSALAVPVQSTHDNGAGTLGYAAFTLSAFPTGTFTLCTVRFSATTTGTTSLTFNAVDPRKTDVFRGVSVLSSATNGSVVAAAATSPTATHTETIEATHAPTNTSTPTATPTPTATVELEPCPGDCDRDGRVSAAEVLQVIYSALDDHVAPCLDGNGDGVVTVEDAVLAGCE